MNTQKKYVEILILILISCSPLIPQVIKGVLLILVLLFNIKYLKTIDKGTVFPLFLITAYFMMSGILDMKNIKMNGEYSIVNFYYPLCFFVGYVFSRKYCINTFFKTFEKIVFITACFSLVGMLVYTVLPSMVFSLPNYNYYDTTHKTALIFNVLVTETGVVTRNTGIASEPGLYQLLLNLAVFAHIKFGEKNNFTKIIVYGIAIIGTRSTVGMLIYCFLIWQIIKKYKYSWIFVLIIIGYLFESIYNEIVYQIQYKFIGSSSFDIRLNPMLNAFKEGSKHFLGLGNSGYDYQYIKLDLGSFDSYSQVFIRYGFVYLILILILLMKIFLSDIILFIIVFLTFFSQSVWFIPIITPIYFYALGNKKSRINYYARGET